MQKLAIAAAVALVVLAVLIGFSLRDDGAGEREEFGERSQLGHPSKSDRASGAQHRGKSSRASSPSGANPPLYSGPAGLAGWVHTNSKGQEAEPAWRFEDGRLISSDAGGIAREIKAPALGKIRFKLAWSNSLRFRILFGSDRGDTSQPDNTFDLVAQRRFVYLRKRWMTKESGGSRIIGQANVSALAEQEGALFEFYVDRERGLISFYVDDQRVHNWIDKDPALGAFGDWLQLIAEERYPVEVSQLTVESWNGVLPDGRLVEAIFEEQAAWAQRVEELKPVEPWGPETEYQLAGNRMVELEHRVRRAEEPADRAEAAEAERAARDALIEAKRRYAQAIQDLPMAEPDPQRSGSVINPYTGQSLDVRGVPSRTRIRDPRDPRGERTFRVP